MNISLGEISKFIRSQYWITQDRDVVKKIIHECSTCKRCEGKKYNYLEEPLLPKQCVSKDNIFSYIGIDYAGLIYVKMFKAATCTWLDG